MQLMDVLESPLVAFSISKGSLYWDSIYFLLSLLLPLLSFNDLLS